MKDKCFIDTNILIYCYSATEPDKRSVAEKISAALYSDCTILYTEDLQHNQLIKNSLRIINPFEK